MITYTHEEIGSISIDNDDYYQADYYDLRLYCDEYIYVSVDVSMQ